MTSAQQNRFARGFTLVELLAVIAIIGVMIAVLVPSFAGLGRGAKMTTAVSQLRTTIALARQNAITRRETTYVVFPSNNNSLYSDTNQVARAFRSYNVYGVRSKYLREWVNLPEGIVFVPRNDWGPKSGDLDTKNIFMQANFLNNLPFPDNTSAAYPIATITFMPDGHAVAGSGGLYSDVYLAEGWTGVRLPIDATFFGWRPKGQTVAIELFPLTGQLKVVDFSDS